MPEPILIAIAAALAGKAVQTFYDFVRTKISGRKQAVAALEAARGKPADSPEVRVLAAELERIDDPGFQTELRERWQAVQRADTGSTSLNMSGQFSGNTVQAAHVEGGINFKQ